MREVLSTLRWGNKGIGWAIFSKRGNLIGSTACWAHLWEICWKFHTSRFWQMRPVCFFIVWISNFISHLLLFFYVCLLLLQDDTYNFKSRTKFSVEADIQHGLKTNGVFLSTLLFLESHSPSSARIIILSPIYECYYMQFIVFCNTLNNIS